MRSLLRRSPAACGAVDDISWLYGRYSSAMYRLAIFITRSADDAEDAVADVFARLSARRGALRDGVDPKAYLLTAVRNSAYSILRSRKGRVELSDSVLAYLSRAEYDGVVGSVPSAMEITKCVALLPEEQREVVLLKTMEQLTFNEIALVLGESISTVASRYRRGIASLRKMLGDDQDG